MNENKKQPLQKIPGRGLMNEQCHQLRIDYLRSIPIDMEPVITSKLTTEQLKSNIESFVGTVELPVAIVGPLLQKSTELQYEELVGIIGTTEGALVASMNRGAQVINDSGGFSAHILHQRMLRSPMFLFENLFQAVQFENWINNNFSSLQKVVTQYSNHALLLEIKPIVIGKIVHVKFIYSTGDASGQNMTTTCTWHACLWIEKTFNEQHVFSIQHFVIDGNGASDKKISYYALQSGRGIHITAECFLSNESIQKYLRTTADTMFQSYIHSMAISRMDGMFGYNINVANAIAGFFVSTGQDLACIHESSTGILQLEKNSEGLYVSISLPNLIIGTVGGGTHLPAQNSVLQFMKCEGNGGIKRLAETIAGFTLALEISTLAAIVSGQFARAHQKLGRNKPVNWLLGSEINEDYLLKHAHFLRKDFIASFHFSEANKIENGILTDLASRVSKKLIGFKLITVNYTDDNSEVVLLKSKPTDLEVMKGLHFMASNINTTLADKLLENHTLLEYFNSHIKELEVFQFLHQKGSTLTPKLIGSHRDDVREIFVLMMEYLNPKQLHIFNSENNPECWTEEIIKKTISEISKVHALYIHSNDKIETLIPFSVDKNLELYSLFNHINRNEYSDWNVDAFFEKTELHLQMLKSLNLIKNTPHTLVHNDFNPRNIAVRNDGSICVYDWELATLNIPQRDVMELLCFVLVPNFSKDKLLNLLNFHRQQFNALSNENISEYVWLKDCEIVIHEYIFSRLSFYLAGSTLVDYSFIKRVFFNAHAILNMLHD